MRIPNAKFFFNRYKMISNILQWLTEFKNVKKKDETPLRCSGFIHWISALFYVTQLWPKARIEMQEIGERQSKS